ncbi:acyl-coenzyme A synthetase/AMP-(fatty) acid ligase [Nocardiopsis arvandica]|uniref:Acyl-coenzyme A synthetase/AMP-(Fatty) acid ligase n=1 Tax=Nocardiopsis sinuspersici TaxID=501010 RepID=A0A7Y9XJK2_9ACTN|nr:AMP-binding protein [Nocardiopsis sinuspersici]NYH55678.1 acyl-coenzyme A synthetase/AMP-(fatty) acid ligase [Nocardiopsis sinuspersici]
MSTYSLIGAFLRNARERPLAPALVWRDEEIGYGDLLDRAESARVRLRGIGAPPTEPVCLLAAKSPEAVAMVLACLVERRAFLIPPPDLGARALRGLVDLSGCRAVLTPEDTPGDRVPVGTDAPVPLLPEHTSFMLTTSGSTGMPKVVPLETRAVDRFTRWAGGRFDLGPGAKVLNHAPLHFDLCLLDVWATLAHGGCVVLVDPGRAARGDHLLDLASRWEVSTVQAVPMFYRLAADAARAGRRFLPSVRHAIITGDSAPGPLLRRLPGLLPNARLYNVYGCTETNDSLLHEIEPGEGLHTPLPLGSPLPGVSAVVVDSDGRPLQGPGNGELWVRTPFQTRGYLGRANDRTAFADLAGSGGRDGERFFRTGDLVRRDGTGRITLEGRRDFHVKVRGVRVNTQEVEHVLLEHPDVVEAAALARRDPVAGHLLHLVVRRAPESRLNSLALRDHCAVRLPRAALPSSVRITDDALPRTSTGKPDREHIARIYLGSGAPTNKEN